MRITGEKVHVDYAPPTVRRGSNPDRPIHIAFACALVPATLGTLIITLWLVTRANFLQVFGLFNIVLGVFCTVGGAAGVLYYAWASVESKRRPVSHWLLRSVVAAALLAGNFPLCGFYMRLAGMHTVRVVNATAAPIDSFVVTDPRGRQWELGPIPANGRTRRTIDARGEGSIIFTAKSKGSTTTDVVESYITSGSSGTTRTVTLNPDGTHTVR